MSKGGGSFTQMSALSFDISMNFKSRIFLTSFGGREAPGMGLMCVVALLTTFSGVAMPKNTSRIRIILP